MGPLLNPALGFGQCLISFKFDNFLYYLVMPFVGSALALIFYEYVYVRSQEYLNEDDDVTDNNSAGDLSLDSEQVNNDHKIEKDTSKEKEKADTETLPDDE